MRDMPTLGESPQNEHKDLDRLEQFWNDRLTYPTGKFDPAWVRAAADQHKRMQTAVPAGSFARLYKSGSDQNSNDGFRREKRSNFGGERADEAGSPFA